jgi:hypothetical protein
MKTKLLAATALVISSFSPALITPAFGQVSDEVQAELNAYCRDVIVPPGQSPHFVITAENVVAGAFTPGGVISKTFQAGSEHRHGGSPNIFGAFDVVTAGGSTSYTFDCQTFNPPPNENANGTYPEGLQFPGVSTVIEDGETTTSVEDGVICISPTKNPGTWRNQNGYTGTCSTAVFYSLAGIPDPIPSNSLPPA